MRTVQDMLAAADAVLLQITEALELTGRLPDSVERAQLALLYKEDVRHLDTLITWLRRHERSELTGEVALGMGVIQANIEARGRSMADQLKALRAALGEPPAAIVLE